MSACHYADSPEVTCNVLQDIAAGLEEKVEGSFCTVRDDDQDSCNDCLWLNCSTALSSLLGTVHVSFTSRFLPCYSYNDSAEIDIHATNNSLFAGKGAALLVTLFAERTSATVVTVDLAGFPGDYVVEFTLEQLGHGILFGVRSLSVVLCHDHCALSWIVGNYVHGGHDSLAYVSTTTYTTVMSYCRWKCIQISTEPTYLSSWTQHTFHSVAVSVQ